MSRHKGWGLNLIREATVCQVCWQIINYWHFHPLERSCYPTYRLNNHCQSNQLLMWVSAPNEKCEQPFCPCPKGLTHKTRMSLENIGPDTEGETVSLFIFHDFDHKVPTVQRQTLFHSYYLILLMLLHSCCSSNFHSLLCFQPPSYVHPTGHGGVV